MKITQFLLFMVIVFPAYGQYPDILRNYERDIVSMAAKDLQEEELNKFFRQYDQLIFPHQGTTALMLSLQNIEAEYFPLMPMTQNQVYKETVNKLLYSENEMHRILAYITIGSAGDTSLDSVLLSRLKTEKHPGCLLWSSMALLYTGTQETDALMEFFITAEDVGLSHLLPLFVELNPEKLIATSLKFIKSENTTANILSLQLLGKLEKSSETDKLIIDCIEKWEPKLKGYAIIALGERENLEKFEILKPYLENEVTRNVSINVLKKSAFKSDKEKIEEWESNQENSTKEK